MAEERIRDPQQWNLYAYARNNPLRMIDPTGLQNQESQPEQVINCGENDTSDACMEQYQSVRDTVGGHDTDPAGTTPVVTTTISFPTEPEQQLSPYAAAVFQQTGENLRGMNTFMWTFAGGSLAGGVAFASFMSVAGTEMVPSVLYADVQSTFNFGASVQVAGQEVNTLRVFGGGARLQGRFSTLESIPRSGFRELLALPPNNTAAAMARVTISRGSTFVSGTVAPAFGHAGGASQIFSSADMVFRALGSLPVFY